MSPAAAIASPIFRFYVALIAILLLAAGVAIALLRWKSSRDVTSAWKAYCGWLLMIPVVLGAIFLGRIATIVLFTGLSLLGFKEFARATGLYRDWLMTGAVVSFDRRGGDRFAGSRSNQRHAGLVRIVHGSAGLRDFSDASAADRARSSRGPTANIGARDPRFHLHRVDVRPFCVSGELG